MHMLTEEKFAGESGAASSGKGPGQEGSEGPSKKQKLGLLSSSTIIRQGGMDDGECEYAIRKVHEYASSALVFGPRQKKIDVAEDIKVGFAPFPHSLLLLTARSSQEYYEGKYSESFQCIVGENYASTMDTLGKYVIFSVSYMRIKTMCMLFNH